MSLENGTVFNSVVPGGMSRQIIFDSLISIIRMYLYIYIYTYIYIYIYVYFPMKIWLVWDGCTWGHYSEYKRAHTAALSDRSI